MDITMTQQAQASAAPIPGVAPSPDSSAAESVRAGGDATQPIPFPASMGQTGEVNKSRISEAAAFDPVAEPERVLKPWGLPMLPDFAKKEEAAEDDSEQQAPTDPVAAAEPSTDSADPAQPRDAAPTLPEAAQTEPAQPADPARPAADPFEAEQPVT